uniref:Uncharacterized protein n=1 Tax=Rhizophora mucronata TaxID=61149 RepID=A0A2P2N3T1_RHIMU
MLCSMLPPLILYPGVLSLFGLQYLSFFVLISFGLVHCESYHIDIANLTYVHVCTLWTSFRYWTYSIFRMDH